ncbi:hypothetical protein [uncultured Henriciella sp.]|jgi:hypothetical protein|uniref:hypothetical protein n=1 Tax=uncultured Henriciella sp. TaxID=1608424 RepID=UPI0026D2A55D|tara:strand:- start:6 stop:1085 length:1080 start_codon:yes stop_codon:yes gene_type:complete
MRKNGQKNVFEETIFSGVLSDRDDKFEMELTLRAGPDSRLVIQPVSVSTRCYVALSKHVGAPGSKSSWLAFEGISSEGTIFRSTYLSVYGHGHGTDGAWLKLAASKAHIILKRSEADDAKDVGVQWSLRGFRSFRNRPTKTSLGVVIVRGMHEFESYDEVTGSLAINPDGMAVDDAWFEKADEMLEFVWRGLEFGHGGRLPISLIQEYRSKEVVATFYEGKGSPPHLPSIHFLNQSDYIECLATHFDRKDTFPEAVWTAVGWLNSRTAIEEVRFLNIMTAIETILENLLPNTETKILPASEFSAVKDSLLATLERHSLAKEGLDIFKGKIKQLNSRTLSQKLSAVLDSDLLPEGYPFIS